MDLQPETNRVVVIGYGGKLWDSWCVMGVSCSATQNFVGEELCANLPSNS